jgi:uncharacterized protein
MSGISNRLKLLEKLLADLESDEAMLLTQLDGFLAGIIICPDLILPGEWLPMVWAASDSDAAPVFESTKEAEQLIELIMQHYNSIVADLQRGAGHYSPLFDIDMRNDDVLWEIWIDGFDTARQLRANSWAEIHAGDAKARNAWAGLVTLVQIGRGESILPKEQVNDLIAKAPDLIPHYIETLNAWRISRQVAGQPRTEARNFGKVGRNEPCPCGSGKKYKRCRGLN